MQAFVINACRGTGDHRWECISTDSDDAGPSIYSDCFLWFSCGEGKQSYKHNRTGTFFIQQVAKVLQSKTSTTKKIVRKPAIFNLR